MTNKFVNDLFLLLNKLKNNEHFAFVRFSDGEVFVMQDKYLRLGEKQVNVGDIVHNFGYSADDYKEYIPEKHSFLRDKLIDSLSFKKKNYFVGAGCASCTCAIKEQIPWIKEHYKNGEEHWTSPNLFVNSNYPMFIGHYVPEFKKHKIVLICSKNAVLTNMPFEVVKDFRVGKNCIVNDHHLEEEIKEWMESNSIEEHVFLFSASSLSEVLIHKLFDWNNKNTYIDIGTTLHKYMKLGIERDYLKAYWNNAPLMDIHRSCN